MFKKDLWKDYLDAFEKKHWEKALSVMETLAKKERRNPNVYLKKGDLLQRLSRGREAAEAYHKAASLFGASGFFEKALAVYKVTLRIDPSDDVAIRNSEKMIAGLEQSRHKSPTVQLPDRQEAQESMPESQPEVQPSDWGSGDWRAIPVESAVPEPVAEVPVPERAEEAAGPASEKKEIPALPFPVVFLSLTPQQNQEIIEKASLLVFSRGSVIINEGSFGDSIYFIKKGRACISAVIRGKWIELATLDEGDVFGEVGFLTGRPRTASVMAGTDMEIFEISRPLLEEAIRSVPAILGELEDFHHKRAYDTVNKALKEFRKQD